MIDGTHGRNKSTQNSFRVDEVYAVFGDRTFVLSDDTHEWRRSSRTVPLSGTPDRASALFHRGLAGGPTDIIHR